MSALPSRLRLLLAICIAVLLVVESAGVARAFGPGSMVHCCCGPHAIARACKCLHCPVKLRRAKHDHDHDRPQASAQLSEGARCAPAFEDGALVIVATPVLRFQLAAPVLASAVTIVPPPRPPTVSLEPARPPP